METRQAWQILETALSGLETGRGRWEHLVAQAQGSIALLMECDPKEVIAQAQAGPRPTRATLSWLVHEAGKIRGVDPAKVRELANCWEMLAPAGQKGLFMATA